MRRRRVAAGAALTLLLAAFATEVALPALAENRVRDELATVGSVTEVEISGFPAVALLFGHVQDAAIHMSSATMDADTLEKMAERMGDVQRLDAEIDALRAGPFAVESVVVKKRGQSLDASATVDVAQVESLVPGAELTVEDGAMLLSLEDLPLPLPFPGPMQFRIGLDGGTVVAQPLGAISRLMPTQPLMDRPELSVTALHSSITKDELTVTATATLEP